MRIVSGPIEARSLRSRDVTATTIIFLLLVVEGLFLLACLLWM